MSTAPPTSGGEAVQKRDFGATAVQNSSGDAVGPTKVRWISHSGRNQTNLDDVVVDSRAFQHNFLFRRPRALLYMSTTALPSRIDSNTSGQCEGHSSEARFTHDLRKQLSRLDLFVDLIWAGIVANLAKSFAEQAFTNSGMTVGQAVLEFILLFLPVWRVWDWLRSYTSHFYLDDINQRLFLVWVLVLAVLYGINAPFAVNLQGERTSLILLISTYVVARVSFLAALSVQSIFLPVVRRQLLFESCCFGVPFGLYIAAIFTPYPGKLAMLIIANFIEHPLTILQSSPVGQRLLLPKGFKKFENVDRYIERYEGFFIIILGEGVFRLIEGSPSGLGINQRTGTSLVTLMIFYVLHWLYFNSDESMQYVHALRRAWWKPLLWQTYHILLFATLLFLDASTRYIIEPHDSSTVEPTSENAASPIANEDIETLNNYGIRAVWSASISLATALFAMTNLALLNRSLDPPKTLFINSRLIRLGPRIPAIAIIACLPLLKNMNGPVWCAAAVGVLYTLFIFEIIGGMERGWKLLEPKTEGGSNVE